MMKKTCCFDMNRTKELIGYSIYDSPKKISPFFEALYLSIVLNVLNKKQWKKYLMEWGRICQIWNL